MPSRPIQAERWAQMGALCGAACQVCFAVVCLVRLRQDARSMNAGTCSGRIRAQPTHRQTGGGWQCFAQQEGRRVDGAWCSCAPIQASPHPGHDWRPTWGRDFLLVCFPSHMVSKQAGGTRPATSRRRAGRRLVIAKAKRRANCNHLLCSIPYYKHAEFGDGSRDLGNGSRVSLTCHEGNASVWIDHWVRVLAWSAPHQQSPAWLCVCVSELPSSAKSCCT